MPGIHEANGGSNNETTEQQSEVIAEDVIGVVVPSNDLNELPPKETDQTDKINKFLLNSFLQHINNQTANMNAESTEGDSVESDADWK